MKVAALYDIHGNLPALNAVLDEIQREGVEQIVVGGDAILGPMSAEVLDSLLSLDIQVHFIQGNCEVSVLDAMEGRTNERLPAQVNANIVWTARQLTIAQKQIIERWQLGFRLAMPRLGNIMFCHATPTSCTQNFTRLTPDEALLTLFKNVDADVVVCGHTHMQFDRTIGNTRVVNAGSVGMPFGKPGAYWILLDSEIEFRRTQYDLMRAAEMIRSTRYPQAEDFAMNNILNPPSEEQMLKILTAASV